MKSTPMVAGWSVAKESSVNRRRMLDFPTPLVKVRVRAGVRGHAALCSQRREAWDGRVLCGKTRGRKPEALNHKKHHVPTDNKN